MADVPLPNANSFLIASQLTRRWSFFGQTAAWIGLNYGDSFSSGETGHFQCLPVFPYRTKENRCCPNPLFPLFKSLAFLPYGILVVSKFFRFTIERTYSRLLETIVLAG